MSEREKLIETKQSILKLIKEAEAQFSGTGKALLDIEDYVAEYLAANGVIVPPCKVGDKVYRIDSFNNSVWEFEVDRLVRVALWMELGHIGKYVFLSKEDAEKVLKGMKK